MIIKCNVCKLSIKDCGYKCMELDDVSTLFKENKTENDALDGFCTNHSCLHNPTGFKCVLNSCVFLQNSDAINT